MSIYVVPEGSTNYTLRTLNPRQVFSQRCHNKCAGFDLLEVLVVVAYTPSRPHFVYELENWQDHLHICLRKLEQDFNAP